MGEIFASTSPRPIIKYPVLLGPEGKFGRDGAGAESAPPSPYLIAQPKDQDVRFKVFAADAGDKCNTVMSVSFVNQRMCLLMHHCRRRREKIKSKRKTGGGSDVKISAANAQGRSRASSQDIRHPQPSARPHSTNDSIKMLAFTDLDVNMQTRRRICTEKNQHKPFTTEEKKHII